MGEWAVNIHIIHTFNMQAAYDDLMLVCYQLGFKRKDRLAKQVRAPPEEEEIMIIEDVEQMSNIIVVGNQEEAKGRQALGLKMMSISFKMTSQLMQMWENKQEEQLQLHYTQPLFRR